VRAPFVVLAALALAGVSALLLGDLAGYDRVLRLLGRLEPVWLPVCLGAELLAYLGYALAVRDMARVDGGPRLSLGETVRTVVAGFGVFAALNTSGGFAADYWALRRAGARREDALARVLGLGALEYAVLAPAALFSALVLIADGAHVQQAMTLPWLLVLPGAAAGFWVSSPRRSSRLGDAGDGGRLRSGFAHTVTGISMLRRLLARPQEHGLGLIGVSLYWFGDIVCLWAALTAFGASLSVPALIVGYATGYALTRRSLPAGGAGLVEVSMTFALTWVGLPFVPALLGVLVYRFFNFWLPIVPALACGGRRLTPPRVAAP
jgi:uncharacterized membrane protein YbhN (UPF0104 family)